VNGVDTIFIPDNGGPGSIVCTGPDCGTAVFPSADANAFLKGISAPGISIDGWTINTTAGGSNSPGCPSAGVNGVGCINDDDISAQITGTTCSVATPCSLVAFFESDGFTAEPGFITAYSSVLQTGALATQNVFIGAGAVNLAAGNLAPAPVGAACGAALSSGPPGVAALASACGPGSGTIEIMTTFKATGDGAFNVNGNVAAVPEPASVALFGTILALCASGLRRRRKVS